MTAASTPEEQIKQLKAQVEELTKERDELKIELDEFKDVVQRIRFVIKESQAPYNESSDLDDIKAAMIEQAIKNGKAKEDPEREIASTLEAAANDPVVKKGLISFLNTEHEKQQQLEAQKTAGQEAK